MARFGPIRRLWNLNPPAPSVAALLRRLAIVSATAFALAVGWCAPRLPAADDLPDSPIFDSGCPSHYLATGPLVSTPFTLKMLEAPVGSANGGYQQGLVAIDEPPSTAAYEPFGTVRGSVGSSFWAALGRWESSLWRPERPTIVLTSAESSTISLDEDAPLMPDNQSGMSPAQTGQQPAAINSDLQPIDVCPCPRISVYDDAWAFLPRVAHDAWGLVNNWDNLIILGVGLGGSLGLRGDVDQDVRNWTAEHPDRWGEGSKALGDLGVVQYQIPVIFGVYALTVWEQDQWGHDMMNSLISAYTVFGLSTLAIKVTADTNRPSDTWNGGKYGFPSWHDGSWFCMSAVIDEYEGHWIGVPLYIVSGLVGWSRIDTRDHDLSDVVFGGILGYVIGKSVAGRALYGDSRAVHIVPYVHPSEGTAGVMFDASF
jgi:hypothetical protein